MANGRVVRYIRKKLEDGNFDSPVYLGSEARFVSSSRGATLNNLEEQLLIGCDTVTEEWVDENGNLRITKEFQDESLASEYYKLDSIIYDYNNITNSDFFFREEEDGSLVLCLTENLNDQKISDTLEDMGETKKVNYNIFYGNNEDVYGYDEDTLAIAPSKEYIMRKDTLFFVSEEEEANIAIQKVTVQKYTIQNRKVIKEKIFSNLQNEIVTG